MKSKDKLSRYRVILFSITSLLLIVFQIGVYVKLCLYPSILDANLWILLLALLWPFLIKFTKNKYVKIILMIAYLVYFAITAGAFFESMFNPNVNCTGIIYTDFSEWIMGPGR